MTEEFNKFMNAFTGILKECDAAVEVSPLFRKLRMLELNAFIGQFSNWKHLNEDCQRKIVEYLDQKTRFNLSLCSKSDRRLVSKVPVSIYSINIDDGRLYHSSFGDEQFNENIFVKIKFTNEKNYNKYNNRVLIFEKAGNDTHIRWVQRNSNWKIEKKLLVLKNKDNAEEAVKFMEEWLRKCNYGVRRLVVEMINYPFESSRIRFLPKCTHLRVRSDDEAVYRWWMQKVPQHLDILRLWIKTNLAMVLPPGFLSSPQILNAKEFFSMAQTPFSETQFLALNSNSLMFRSTNISDSGINKFIKRWVDGKHPNKTFRWMDFTHRKTDDERTILEGVCAEPYEDPGNGGTVFKIPSKVAPLEWLKLRIDEDKVSISKKPEYQSNLWE